MIPLYSPENRSSPIIGFIGRNPCFSGVLQAFWGGDVEDSEDVSKDDLDRATGGEACPARRFIFVENGILLFLVVPLEGPGKVGDKIGENGYIEVSSRGLHGSTYSPAGADEFDLIRSEIFRGEVSHPDSVFDISFLDHLFFSTLRQNAADSGVGVLGIVDRIFERLLFRDFFFRDFLSRAACRSRRRPQD